MTRDYKHTSSHARETFERFLGCAGLAAPGAAGERGVWLESGDEELGFASKSDAGPVGADDEEGTGFGETDAADSVEARTVIEEEQQQRHCGLTERNRESRERQALFEQVLGK